MRARPFSRLLACYRDGTKPSPWIKRKGRAKSEAKPFRAAPQSVLGVSRGPPNRDAAWFRRDRPGSGRLFPKPDRQSYGLSPAACSRIRAVMRVLHPRHWEALRELLSVRVRIPRAPNKGARTKTNSQLRGMSITRYLVAFLLVGMACAPLRASALRGTLYDAAFPRPPAAINKAIIVRVNPWILRVISPSPSSFNENQPRGDSEAIVTDSASVQGIVHALQGNLTDNEGCDNYTAAYFPYSWTIVFYDDRPEHFDGKDIVVGSVFISLTGSCAATNNKVYAVDPEGIRSYLSRTFSFMNF